MADCTDRAEPRALRVLVNTFFKVQAKLGPYWWSPSVYQGRGPPCGAARPQRMVALGLPLGPGLW